MLSIFLDNLALLYTAIFAVTTFWAFKSQRYAPNGAVVTRGLPFLLAFLTAWAGYVFIHTGRDLPVYLEIYNRAQFGIHFDGVEPGYLSLNAFLRLFITNEYVGVGVIKTIQLGLVFYSFWIFRDKTRLGFAVMAYMALCYLPSFNVIRISLAASMSLFVLALLYKQHILGAALITCSLFFIHNSSAIFVLTLFLFWVNERAGRWRYLFRIVLGIMTPIIIAGAGYLISRILATQLLNSRYETAYANAEGTMGLGQVVFYLPIFWALYQSFKTADDRERRFIKNIGWVFTIAGFAVALVGYQVGMIARMSVYYMFPFSILVAYYLCEQASQNMLVYDCENNTRKRGANLAGVFFLFYFCCRYVIAFSVYWNVSGLKDWC